MMFAVRHIPRVNGETYTDRTEWVVVEESPSFYICYGEGDGYCMKRKKDYEIVSVLVAREYVA